MRRICSIVAVGWIAMLGLCARLSTALSQLPNPSHIETITMGNEEVLIAEGNADTIDSGARIWDSGRALSKWMTIHLQEGQPTKILELGAGTGIVGLTAAAFADSTSVVLTDQPHMIPLLEENIDRNDLQSKAKAVPLEWGTDSDEVAKVISEDSSSMPVFDIVCGSDILYSPDNFSLLLETLCQICTPSVTEVVLAYPRRFTEDIFCEAAIEWFEVSPEEEIDDNIFLTRLRLRA